MGRGRLAGVAIAAALAVGAAGCVSTPNGPRTGDPIRGAAEQPFRDLSLLRDAPVERLRKAAEAPYALSSPVVCADLLAEIAALDAILGPDVDSPEVKGSMLGRLSGDTLRGALSLPFRGPVRALSGAEQRDRTARQAVQAGQARRSFLKGVSAALTCPVSATPSSAP